MAADKGIQLLAQEHWIKTYKDQHTWAMLPNADEFIVLKKVLCASLAFPAPLVSLVQLCVCGTNGLRVGKCVGECVCVLTG